MSEPAGVVAWPAPPAARDPWRSLRARPLVCCAAGAVVLGSSGVVFRLAEVSAATGAFFRFALSLPFLAALAWRERGPGRSVGAAVLPAGVLITLDMILWHLAIEDVGAGLGTVLGNTQVIFVTLIGWAVLGERLTPRAAVGVALVFSGVVLISGVLESAPYGGNPVRGTCFGLASGLVAALYIVTLRKASVDPRRPVRPLFVTTLLGVLVAWPAGMAMGELDLTPAAESLGWLFVLAVTSQVIGWLLLAVPLRTLPATTTSIVLNAQPVAALVFAAVVIAETPTELQLGGGVVTVVALAVATGGRRDLQARGRTPSG